MSESILAFYEELGFEEMEIEEGLTALAFETAPDGGYALVTDEDGKMPETLTQPIIFAFYTPEGSFQWSTGFKNSRQFQETWLAASAPKQKLELVREFRSVQEHD